MMNLMSNVSLPDKQVPKIDVKNSTDKELKKATDAFESIFIKMVLDKSIPDSNSMFGKGVGSKIYSSMYKDQLSKMSAGNYGISDLLYNQLKGSL